MPTYISTEKLILEAHKKGVSFGKGDPYNRLRYYTKMGWLPHMIRKKGEAETAVKGHYPYWALNRLLLIESLKNNQLTNEEISAKVAQKNSFHQLMLLLTTKEALIKLVTYSLALLGIFFLLTQAGLININTKLSKPNPTKNLEFVPQPQNTN